MPQLTITHSDGSTETIPQTVGYERTREVGKMRRARITVERSLANSVALEPKSDTIDLGSIDTLRLVDIENGAETYTLVCYSFEWDANRVAPTVGGDLRTGDDQTLITNLIGEVSNWSKGTVTSLSRPLEFVFNHAARHEALRRIERNVPGEILFRDGGTVDYTSRLGSDKSGSVELSASAGTIEDEITITNRGRELDGTHFRVLGAHEGEAQLSANLVPASDSDSYDNRVNYTSPRWSDGDPRDWDRYENKDVTDQDTLFEEAENLGDEIKEELIEAETTVPDGVNIDVGDTVRVVKPTAGLDRDMRIHRLKEVVEGAVRKLDVLLSTRTTARKDGSDDLRDIQRFNTGFQGSSVNLQAGPVLQPVSSSINASIPFRYPDVDFEHVVECRVAGRPYRSYVGAAGHDHTVTISDATVSQSNGDFSNVEDSQTAYTGTTLSRDNWNTIATYTPSVDTSEVRAEAYLFWPENSVVKVRLRNLTTGYTTNGGVEYTSGTDETFITQSLFDATNCNGETIVIEARSIPSSTTDPTVTGYTTFHSVGQHDHTVSISDTTSSTSEVGFEPGVNLWDGNDQSPELEPSNVDVVVNGTTVASNVGTGTFETVADISGALNPGAWNEVELSSDSKGFVNATVAARAYQQIGTR